jgi:hypothetical protein
MVNREILGANRFDYKKKNLLSSWLRKFKIVADEDSC